MRSASIANDALPIVGASYCGLLRPDGYNTGDSGAPPQLFRSVDASGRVDRTEFSDGTVWTYGDIQSALLKPIEGNDSLDGYVGNDVIDDLGVDDDINGRTGDDLLRGGFGNDTLEGGAGNDRLRGYGIWLNELPGANTRAIASSEGLHFQ